MLRVTAEQVRLDTPAPLDPWSRLVLGPGGSLVLAALESRGARGPWVVADLRTGDVRLGRNLAPVVDGRLGQDGRGLLLTQRGLASVELSPRPRVVAEHGAGLGRGSDHLDHLEVIAQDVVVVGRWYRPVATVVRASTGEILRRLDDASGPYLTLPSDHGAYGDDGDDGDDGTVRVWAVGSGVVLALNPRTWEPVARRTLDVGRGLAACRTPDGAVGLIGSVDPGFDEGLVHALLRDVAPCSWRPRLRSPFADLRLARLDARLEVTASVEPSWLRTDLPDPDRRGPGRLTVDAAGRPVLVTSDALTVLDPTTGERVAEHPTYHPATLWHGTSRAVHPSGDRELTVVEWG